VAYEKGEPAYRDEKKKAILEPGIWHLADGTGYVVDIWVKDPKTGERFRLRKREHRISLARTWRNTQQDAAAEGKLLGRQTKVIPFSKFADEYYKAWKVDCKASTATTEWNRIEGILKPYFGRQHIHAITRKDIEAFIRKRRDGSLVGVVAQRRRNNREGGVTRATTNRDLCRLKNMLKKAVEWEYLKENPAIGIPQSKETFEPAEYLAVEEVEKFLAFAEEEYRAIFVTAVYTGMRYGEIMNLDWEDIDFT